MMLCISRYIFCFEVREENIYIKKEGGMWLKDGLAVRLLSKCHKFCLFVFLLQGEKMNKSLNKNLLWLFWGADCNCYKIIVKIWCNAYQCVFWDGEGNIYIKKGRNLLK